MILLALASQAMRRVLIDYAVARLTQKRGGGKHFESLDGDALAVVQECPFYGGMSIEETAEALEVSPATLKRDWALARAWLNRELSSE